MGRDAPAADLLSPGTRVRVVRLTHCPGTTNLWVGDEGVVEWATQPMRTRQAFYKVRTLDGWGDLMAAGELEPMEE